MPLCGLFWSMRRSHCCIVPIAPQEAVVRPLQRSLTEPRTHHGEVGVICGEAQTQFGFHLRRHPLQHTVEDVVVPLVWSLEEKRALWSSHHFVIASHIDVVPDLTCRHTRDFSSRYCSILAPSMAPRLLKWMSTYFPKRLELSLRIVFAFPKAERKINQEWEGQKAQGHRPRDNNKNDEICHHQVIF